MKRIEKLLLNGSGYAVLILTAFYIFINLADFDSKTIGMGKFFLILGFSMIISLAETVYELLKLNKILKCLIHYLLLLAAFSIIFVAGEFFTVNSAESVFVLITVFTLFYFVMWATVHFVRQAIGLADKKLDSAKKSKSGKTEKEKSQYKSLYK